ncbi:ferrichrome ABC transporter substrate-binding protein [Bacillus manliponensis]|uniref:Ferrichrome ABC transporter substrate-binding protein n=1 Tax=Bacillus manliponensis TaxID=574376 RepID=A0A073KGY1_9BACI|nr:ABC transporter substrate-binding protein [Bacillus manliponensis]KEK21563.1 ferrichrome ABC transporter substrate-binding protein [Bacillus manliponensis]
MKKSLYGTLFLSACLVLGGCTDDKAEQTATKEKVAADHGSEAAKAKDETTNTSEGIETLVKQFPSEQPKSIVTTSVSIAEMLHILDVKPVGLPTTTHKLPEGFDQITQIGSAIEPDVEKIVSLQPDIVVGPESIKDSLEKKITNGNVKTAYLPTDSYEDLIVSFEALGKALGKEKEANKYLADLEKKEKAILKDLEGKKAPKVMVLFGSGESFMLMNETTYVGSLVKKLGAQNIVTEQLKTKESYVPLNMEDVITANPDAILLVSHGDPKAALEQFKTDVKNNGAWEKLNAFKNDKVQALDYSTFGYASIEKAPVGLEQLSEILYK